MAINKVVYGNNTLLDLTEDTVTEEDVLEGKTFHDKSGQKRTGSATQGGRVQDVEVNGESVVDENGVAEVVVPVSGDVSTTDSFESYTGGKVKSLQVQLSPNQDLHGYDSPWVGGAGKNKLQVTATTQTVNGVTFTVNSDGTIKTTGTSSNGIIFDIGTYNITAGTYVLSGCPSSGNTSTYYFDCRNDDDRQVYDDGSGRTFTSNGQSGKKARIIINSGVNVDNLIWKPMIRSSSDSSDFAPYSNICPISGHTEVDVGDDGKNLFDESYPNIDTYVKYKSIYVGDGTFTMSTTTPVATGPSTNLFFLTGQVTTGASTATNGVSIENSRTIQSTNGYVTVAYRNNNNIDPRDYHTQIESGSTATAYVPYNGYQITVNLGGTYYSGTLDVVSGKLTVDKAFVKGNDLTWLKHNTSANNVYYSGELQSIIKRPSDNYTIGDIVCSDYVAKAWENVFDANQVGVVISTSGLLGVANPNITTLEDFQTAIADTDICYGLSTPLTIQLSPTMVKALVGENHFSAPLEQQEIIEIIARNIAEFNEVIDDENVSDKFTYSSEKIEDRLDGYVDKDAYFTLPLQTFTFTNKICNVNDSRVTSNSLVDVYFTSDSMSSVEDAGITVESQNGKIVMTAEEQPVGTIQGRIKVVN